jgi:hypothetical protein
MIHWEGHGRKQSWPILRYYRSIFLEGLNKTSVYGQIFYFRTSENWAERLNPLFFKRYPALFKWASRHGGVLGEWRYTSTHSLTSALDGGEWSASRPGRFNPRVRAPSTHWVGGWVGSRVGLDAVVEKFQAPVGTETHNYPACTQPYTTELLRLLS